MKCCCDVQDTKKGSLSQQEFSEEQFFEQFAALEEGLARVQSQLRGLSENAELFGRLVRHMRRSTCPVKLAPNKAPDKSPAFPPRNPLEAPSS
jgi:hypothetical protein